MITIFTDGAARGNPGPGGWGTIVVSSETVVELGGREDHTTNNRMELSAAIGGLAHVPDERDIVVYTDSAYLISGITKWIFGWKKNDWKTSTKEEVLNRDLWETLFDLVTHKAIEWKLLKGHSGIPANERCDVIATSFADKKPTILFNGPKMRYTVSLSVAQTSSANSDSKTRSKKAYSYVSMVDNVIQTHKTWEECKARVHGVSSARFKKSVSPEDEENIINDFGKM